jgi:hypothetical protein
MSGVESTLVAYSDAFLLAKINFLYYFLYTEKETTTSSTVATTTTTIPCPGITRDQERSLHRGAMEYT